MKIIRLIRSFGIAVLCVSATVALSLAIRGLPGNPNATELNDKTWKEDGPFELSPERGRFVLTYAIVNNQSLFFSPELARFTAPDVGYSNGKYVSLFAPGVSYLAIPGYIVGSWFGLSQLGAFSMSALFALINTGLIYLIAKKTGLPKIAGILASFIFLFASPAYAYATTLYQHHISTALILGALYLVMYVPGMLSLSLVWFLCASSILIDYPNLFLMAPIGFYALSKVSEITKTKNIRELKINLTKLASLLIFIVPLSLFMWFNYASYGNPLQFSGTVKSVSYINEQGYPAPHPQEIVPITSEIEREEDQKKSSLGFFEPRDLINGLYTHIFSPDRGIIIYAPVLLLGIIGAVLLYKKNKTTTMLIIAITTTCLLLYSMWGDPWGGWAFGSRYLIPAYAMLAILLSAYLSHYRRNLLALLIFFSLSIYSVYINTAGALSSNANPPQVQVLALEALSGRQERYSYDRNIEYLRSNQSKSFIYQAYLKDHVTAWQYFEIIVYALIALVSILTLALFTTSRSKK